MAMDTTLSTTKLELPRRTYADIMALDPCYDPAEGGLCTPLWTGTALDVLRNEFVSAEDALWLVLREEWIPAPVLHEFACAVAERALSHVAAPDMRSVAAIATKRAWLCGEATDEQLTAAWDAAWDIARTSIIAAACAAAAKETAWAAARTSAEDAAWAAAMAAARTAAARDAAWAAERARQRADLIALLEAAD